MKQALGLIIGLLVGAAGAILFSRSLPPPEGSAEERLEIVQRDLEKARRTIRRIDPTGNAHRSQRNVRDGLRDIMQDIREGRDVSVDDIFATMKPWMRDMAPLFNRIREINEENWADSMTGEWTRKYNLSKAEQAQLKEWFKQKSLEKANAFVDVVESDSSGFVDFVRATEYDFRDEVGIEEAMGNILKGEELESFQKEQLAKRAASVEEEANRGMTRLDDIVALDQDQRNEVFGILARGSGDYRQGEMAFDGAQGDTNALDRDARNDAIRSVMRPDQVELLDNHRAERQAEAEKEMRRVGLTLPENWDYLEGDTF